jgi:hypothetical protein
MKKYKLALLLIGCVVLILGIIIGAVFVSQSNNSWVCKDGQWLRQGSPQYSQPKTPCVGTKKAQTNPVLPPDSTVAGFYTALKNAPQNGSESPIHISSYVSASYNKPDFCSTEQLKSFKILKAAASQSKAQVNVQLQFETKTATASVDLIGEGSQWKIMKITCALQ